MNSKIKEITKLLGLKEENSSLKCMESCINQLKKIPYIPYPVALHTVDVIPFKYDTDNEYKVLLGRKKYDKKYCVVGGFIEAGETAEQAVQRELMEETGLFFNSNLFNYNGTFVIDDERFKLSSHKISTSFYDILLGDLKEEPHAMDDIVEIKWFNVHELIQNVDSIVQKKHVYLISFFYKKYWDKNCKSDE